MVIVEMIGCPGIGKSVVSNIVRNKILNAGCKVYSPPKKWNRMRRLQTKIEECCVYFNPTYRKLWKKGKVSVPELENQLAIQWFMILFNTIINIDKAEREGMELILLDEGCVQQMSSITHGKDISNELLTWAEEVYSYVFNGRKVIFIWGELSMEENIRRLRKRNRPGDRFVAETDGEIIGRLELKKRNLEKLVQLVETAPIKVPFDDLEHASRFIVECLLD